MRSYSKRTILFRTFRIPTAAQTLAAMTLTFISQELMPETSGWPGTCILLDLYANQVPKDESPRCGPGQSNPVAEVNRAVAV